MTLLTTPKELELIIIILDLHSHQCPCSAVDKAKIEELTEDLAYQYKRDSKKKLPDIVKRLYQRYLDNHEVTA